MNPTAADPTNISARHGVPHSSPNRYIDRSRTRGRVRSIDGLEPRAGKSAERRRQTRSQGDRSADIRPTAHAVRSARCARLA
ncbi:unnamed protein product [Lampetra planeri]